jgi:hypothetical protein
LLIKIFISTSFNFYILAILSFLGSDGKLTAEEHARRIAEDLCRYCGDSDHTTADCPRLQAITAARSNSMPQD